jgi:hypothetical protein
METEGKIKRDRNKSCEDVTWDKISHYAQWQASVSSAEPLGSITRLQEHVLFCFIKWQHTHLQFGTGAIIDTKSIQRVYS